MTLQTTAVATECLKSNQEATMANKQKNNVLCAISVQDRTASFLSWLVRIQLQNRWGSVVVSCCCGKLAAESGDSSGTQRKGNVRR
jgi:hypothetical protein